MATNSELREQVVPADAELMIIILTFNSAAVIDRTICAARKVTGNIVCVDSGSTDETRGIAAELGCKIFERPFKNYADQRNWAIETLGNSSRWQLHLDADEVLDDAAVQQILQALSSAGEMDGFMLRRKTYFMGRALHFGGTMSWHLRLFRSGRARCESRLYDQHFICDGPIKRLQQGWLHDLNGGTLAEWVNRHNRWSDLESSEVLQTSGAGEGGQLKPDLLGDPRQRTRYYKGIYYRMPLLFRATLYFFYRYFLRGGFLDGRAGFIIYDPSMLRQAGFEYHAIGRS
jgi:glycosyltransferase involved in cell wall biosynthesis